MKPNVLVLAHEPYLNGASHSLLTVLIGLKENLNFLVVLPSQGAMSVALTEKGISWVICKLPRCAVTSTSLWQLLLKKLYFIKNKQNHLARLKQTLGNFMPHVIYTNTSVQDLGFDLSRKLQCPHIWHIREYGDLDFNYHYLPTRNRIQKKMSQSESVVFTTNDLKKHWKISGPNLSVIYNGVVTHPIEFHDVLNWQFPLRISVVGLVMPTKGQLEALNIIKVLHDQGHSVLLQIFGEVNDAAYHEQLLVFIEKYQLQSSVVWKGYVAQEALYPQTDVLLSCAKNEGFGRTIIEAMSRGIPVIARAKGGPLEIIKPGISGLLFTNESEAVHGIHQLIENKNLRLQLSTQGRLHAHEHFGVENYTHQVYSLLKKMNYERIH